MYTVYGEVIGSKIGALNHISYVAAVAALCS